MSKLAGKWIHIDTNSLEVSGSNLQVFVDDSSIERTASGLGVKALGITDGMLAGSISFSKLADSANIARLDQAETIAAIWDYGSNLPTASTNPTSDNQLARKAYVDSVAQNLDIKEAVRVSTDAALPANTYDNGTAGVGATLTADANGSINGTGIDGITDLALNDRILVQSEGTAANNGIYELTQVGDGSNPWILTRTTDADEGDTEVSGGLFTFVVEGTTCAGCGFVLITSGSITMGTTALNFSQFSGAGQVLAGDGIDKTGNTISVDSSDIVGTGLEDDGSNNIRIASSAAGNGLTGGGGSALAVGAGDGITVNASDIEVNVSDIAGTNLEDDGSNNLRIAATAAGNGLTGGGASSLAVGSGDGITVNANDVAVNVSDIVGTNLENDGSNNIRIASSAAGNGLTGGGASTLAVGGGNGITINANDVAVNPSQLITGGNAEIDGDQLDIDFSPSNYTPSTSPAEVDNVDHLTAHLAGIDTALGSATGETVTQIFHTVTGGEDTAGFLTLPSNPVNAQSVRVHPVGGPAQVNKQLSGATSPDFDVLNTDEVHINNNGSATGLSGDITSGDDLLITYQV